MVQLTDGVEGYLRASELSRDHVEDARSILSEGKEIDSKIISIDRKNRRISLSIKALEADQETEAIKEYKRKSGTSTATLGDKLKEQLEKTSS